MTETDRWSQMDALLDLAMAEDIGTGDVTTNVLIAEDAKASGRFVTRDNGVLAGIEVIARLYSKLDKEVTITRAAPAGSKIHHDQTLATIEGPARSILAGERLALNLLQRMCGVATLTRRYVEAVEGTRCRIFDTRKTMPGLRTIDKLAVYIGGGINHRRGLFDMILIKDNHLRLNDPSCPQGSVACAIHTAREKSKLEVMVEVETMEQLKEAIDAEPDMILLDNMDTEMLAEAVEITNRITTERRLRRPSLEASGRVTLQTVKQIAETGVDRISVGAITHSAKSLDIGLDLDLPTA